MAIVYSALLPYSDDLLSSNAQKNILPKTSAAIAEVNKEISASQPETILLVNANPVGPLDPYSAPVAKPDEYYYYGLDKLSTGSFDGLSLPSKVFDNDLELLEDLRLKARPLGLKINAVPHIKLDKASSIIAELLAPSLEKRQLAIVHLPYVAPSQLIDFGSLIKAALSGTENNVALIGAGNLSSRLTKDGPAGFKKEGQEFDELFKKSIAEKNLGQVLAFEAEKLEAAGENTSRTLAVLAGANSAVRPALRSYEMYNGTGYAVVSWQP